MRFFLMKKLLSKSVFYVAQWINVKLKILHRYLQTVPRLYTLAFICFCCRSLCMFFLLCNSMFVGVWTRHSLLSLLTVYTYLSLLSEKQEFFIIIHLHLCLLVGYNAEKWNNSFFLWCLSFASVEYTTICWALYTSLRPNCYLLNIYDEFDYVL